MAERDSRRPRRRRSNALIDIGSALLGLIVIGIVVVGGVAFFGLNRFHAEGPNDEDTIFVVERNSGLGLVAERLENAGLIENRLIFIAGGYALRKQGQIKAGEFNIAANATMADILSEITDGRAIQHMVTIPEGYTVWQVVDRLNQVDDALLTGEITALPPEGSVLPQTYTFDRGDTRGAVLARMQSSLTAALDEVWASCVPTVCGENGPIKTPQELVTLASIVEKETGVPDERDRVAAVFINRLNRGMRLQSDPTIIYGITRGAGPLGRGLRRSEIEQQTPYNTYQVDGLPIGPIANPGVESLRAVANPATTNELYFVAKGAVPSDGHAFAETYAEHRRNVANWRAIERQMAADAERAEAEAAAAARDAIDEAEAEAAGDAPPAP